MSTAIITGSTGFIGGYLAEELIDNGYHVVLIVRDKSRLKKKLSYSRENVTVIQSELDKLDQLELSSFHPDVFFHFAWGGVNREEIDNELIHKRSYEVALQCLNLSAAIGCKCFIDAGSRTEYGIQQGRMHEVCECMPCVAYARWKFQFYKDAYVIAQKSQNLNYLHLRFFSVIGVGDHPWSLVSTACNNFRLNKRMSFGACDQLWNYMDVRDASRAVRLLYENSGSIGADDNRIVNIAGYDNRILRSFVEEIYQITNSRSTLDFDQGKSNISVCADPGKLERITKWKPMYSFHDSICKILDSI